MLLSFPQKYAAVPGACSTSLKKGYCSETPLVPKSPPSLQPQMEIIYEPLNHQSPPPPPRLAFYQPAPAPQ